MACTETEWTINVVKGAGFSRVLTFLNDSETPVNLIGAALRMIVKPANHANFDWGTAGGEILVVDPDGGKIKFELQRAQIEALTFKTAVFYLFLTIEGAESLILSGTVQVR